MQQPPIASPTERSDTPGDKRDFFVSFNRADRPWATWIAWVLEEKGYSVFFQDWDFRGNFVLDMDEALKRSTRMVAVLSPDFLASNFTAPEWAARFAQDPRSRQGLLIPVRVRECEIEGLLAQITYADLTGCEEAEAQQRLLERVKKAVDPSYRAKPATRPGFPGGPPRQVPDRPRFPVAEHNLPQPNRTVGRMAELEALMQALAATGRGAITQPRAITGLGGIGKTQLALAYAYTHLADYDLIRWLRAEEPTALAADYAGLAPALGLDPETPDQAALIAAIRGRLERTNRWLLVFDNATQPAAIEPYLPPTGRGHVLITSRWRDWEGMAEALELEVLPKAEAIDLLLGEGIGDAAQHAAAAELAGKLGRLPLALAQHHPHVLRIARGRAVGPARAEV
jgi:hypothetical protein